MAVVQPMKNKFRLVLDIRELNAHVVCHTSIPKISAKKLCENGGKRLAPRPLLI